MSQVAYDVELVAQQKEWLQRHIDIEAGMVRDMEAEVTERKNKMARWQERLDALPSPILKEENSEV
jgi:hypothetical protein